MEKPKIFDPWTSSFEEALKLQQEVDYPSDPQTPIYQKAAAEYVLANKEIIESGDGFEVLACIKRCVNHGLIAPLWLIKEFNKRYDAVLNAKAKSWDDDLSFGSPYKKGTHLNAIHKKRMYQYAVYNEIKIRLKEDPKPSIGDALFEEVGKKFNLGKTLVQEYYYGVEKLLELPR